MDSIKHYHQTQGIKQATLCDALLIPRASYYRYHTQEQVPCRMTLTPSNKLTNDEQHTVLDILHSERFVDNTPYEIYHTLLDEGLYYCSVSSMYRLLRQAGETQVRRVQRKHRDAVKPELIAVKPNEVWSWDITKLLSVSRLVYYYLYVILDIYSRYVVGWMVADKECKELAEKLIQTTALRQGIQPGQLILHADNGGPMIAQTVAQLLEHIGIRKSHNRPYTSNDNPFSESQFKTLKYCAQFPERFEHIDHAEKFCKQFFTWYNAKHYHSGIHYLTPETVHYHREKDVLENRYQTLLNAFNENPARFNHKKPQRKILLPVYINPPQTVKIKNDEKNYGQQEVIVA